MIKLNQPATLELSVPSDKDISTATDATVTYYKPDGTTGTWSDGVTLNTETEKVSYEIPADTLDQIGNWRFVANVFFGALSYPGEAHIEFIYARSA